MSPRHKEFDPEQVLDNAMRLFWKQGYEATSVQDLVEHTGINRFSLYDTFGDKHALFMAACRRFQEQMESERIRALEESESGLTGIRAFFAKLDASVTTDDNGCLMTNSVTERALSDEQLRDWAQSFLIRLEDAFCRAIVTAQNAGEITTRKRPRELARYLTCLTQGINVMGRAFPDRRRVKSIVRVALSELQRV